MPSLTEVTRIWSDPPPAASATAPATSAPARKSSVPRSSRARLMRTSARPGAAACPSPPRAVEAPAHLLELAPALAVVAAHQLRRHQQRRGEHVRLLLGHGQRRTGVCGLALIRIHGHLTAEERLLAGAVHDVVPELVADREAAPRRPLAGLLGVDPDLALGGQQQARDESPGRSAGQPGAVAHVIDVADVEAVDGVDDVLDRDRQRLAIPDVGGDLGQHLRRRAARSLPGRSGSPPSLRASYSRRPTRLPRRRRSPAGARAAPSRSARPARRGAARPRCSRTARRSRRRAAGRCASEAAIRSASTQSLSRSANANSATGSRGGTPHG